MTATLPENYKYYRATVIGPQFGCGPIDVITNNTVTSTEAIQQWAENKFPGDGFLTGEVMWVESDQEPPQDVLDDFFAKWNDPVFQESLRKWEELCSETAKDSS